MADIELVIKIPEELKNKIDNANEDNYRTYIWWFETTLYCAIKNGTPLTPKELADALMEERIRGELDSDTTFEKDIIRDVKCRLTVSIRDHRPCYCGAELREVWRESEGKE